MTGTVRLPNGSLSRVDRSLLERFAELLIKKALALTASCGCVRPVGRGVDVTLKRILNDGSKQSGPNSTSSGVTNDQGQYLGHLPVNTHEDTPGGRYLVSVGTGPDTTRAFVFATNGEAVDVDFASEAAVQVILCAVSPASCAAETSCGVSPPTNQSVPLDLFSANEIHDLVDAIRNLPGTASGNTPADVNASAFCLAVADPGIQAMLIADAGFLPTPTFTRPPRPTATRTPAIPTFTPVKPSPTPIGNTPTPTPSFTSTIPATMTPSVTHVVTPTLTPTGGVSDTPTSTATGGPASPTATATTEVSATPTGTGGASPTATQTGPPAVTATPTSTVAGATPTATSTVAGATPTFTNTVPGPTDTPTSVSLTATPSVTPTTGGGQTIPVGIAPGGGTSGSCRGTCSGGDNNGKSCGKATDCPGTGATCATPKTCVGGPYDGKTCANAGQCNACDPNKICTAAGTPVSCCSGAAAGTCPLLGSCAVIQGTFPIRVPLNGVCLPRSFPPGDVDCTTDVECHICVGGANNGKTCSNLGTDCPGGACSGSGTCQLAKMDLVAGVQNANNEIPLDIPKSSLVLNPAIVSGIGAVCVAAGGDGSGLIDCDGGHTNLNATASRDHNTTPKVCLTGTSTKAGNACTKNSDCTLTGGGTGVCNNTCFGGTKAGNACATSADCAGGGSCQGNSGSASGLPDDPTCTATAVQPDGSTSYACREDQKQCSGGTKAGTVCTADTDCPGSTCSFCNIGVSQTCSASSTSNAGKPCETNSDCPGGTCVTTVKHSGVCNSPEVITQSGNFKAGDAAISLPLGITILSAPALKCQGGDKAGQTCKVDSDCTGGGACRPPADWGPDGLACTGDETAAPSPPVSVLLSTGTNIVQVFDAADLSGNQIAPGQTSGCGGQQCVAQITGTAGSCPLNSSSVKGVVLGGGFPAVDSPAGDIATIFQFSVR